MVAAVALAVAGLLGGDRIVGAGGLHGLLGLPATAGTAAVGLGVGDLVPVVLAVLAGAGDGWRRADGRTWTPRRRWRRGAVLVAAGAGSVAVLAGAGLARGELAGLAPDAIWRLALALGLVAALWRLPGWLLAPVAVSAAAAPAALAGAGVAGRAVRHAEPWTLEAALGVARTGVPATSLPGVVAAVLAGVGLGVWVRRRPDGPASAGALATVAVWAAGVTLVVGQLRPPVPVLVDLPVVTAALTVTCVLLAVGHLVVRLPAAPAVDAVAAVGRTALVWTATGAAGLLLAAPHATLQLPAGAALTAGGVVAVGVAAAALRLERLAGPLRA